MSLTEEQLKLADSLRWYHAIDYGSHQTRGRSNPPYPPNMTLFGVMEMLNGIDVKGMRCLEVGPAHGVISIGLALRGAQVIACDIGGKKPPQIELSEKVFSVWINYQAPIPLEDVPKHFDKGSFDLIVCAGVMYHLINPADVFFRLRPLLKQQGLIVMETVYAPDVAEPVLVLNSEDAGMPQPTTYFVPSASALVGMAKLACFDVLATRVNSPSRFSLTGRAVEPSDVRDRGEFLQLIHRTGFEDPMFRIKEFANNPSSSIRYQGGTGHKFIDVYKHAVNFAPHPEVMTNVVGRDFRS